MDLLQVTAMSFLQSGQRYSPYPSPYEAYGSTVGAPAGAPAGGLTGYPLHNNNTSPSSSSQTQSQVAASLLMSSLAQHQTSSFPLRAFYGLGGGMGSAGVVGSGQVSPGPGPLSGSTAQQSVAAPAQTATTSASPLAGVYGSYSAAYSGFNSSAGIMTSAPFGMGGGFGSSGAAVAQTGFGSSAMGGVGTTGGSFSALNASAPPFGSAAAHFGGSSFSTGAGSCAPGAANSLYGLAGFGVGVGGLSGGLTGGLSAINPFAKSQFAGSMGAFGMGGQSATFGGTGLLTAASNDANSLLSAYQHCM